MGIMEILQSITAPLVPDLFLATLVSGLLFGAFYNAKLDLPRINIWHLLRAGLNFILMLFIFRSLYAYVIGAVLANPLGWVGIGILWLLYCFFMLLGQIIGNQVIDYLEDHNKKITK